MHSDKIDNKNKRKLNAQISDGDRDEKRLRFAADSPSPSAAPQSEESREFSEDEIARIRQLRQKKAGGAPLNVAADYEGPAEVQGLSSDADDFGVPLEPFNMNQEMQEGQFDSFGHYIPRKVQSAQEVRDPWLDSIDVNDGQNNLDAGSSGDQIPPQDAASPSDSSLPVASSSDISKMQQELVSLLQAEETPMSALQRLKQQAKHSAQKVASQARFDLTRSRAPASNSAPIVERLSEDKSEGAPMADQEDVRSRSSARAAWQRRKVPAIARMSAEDQRTFDRITELCDSLLNLGHHDIYQRLKPDLLESAPDGDSQSNAQHNSGVDNAMLWQFRWKKPGASRNTEERGSSSQSQAQQSEFLGPYPSAVIAQWVRAGYITDENGIEMREVLWSGEPVDGNWRDWKEVRLDGDDEGSNSGAHDLDNDIRTDQGKDIRSSVKVAAEDLEKKDKAEEESDDEEAY